MRKFLSGRSLLCSAICPFESRLSFRSQTEKCPSLSLSLSLSLAQAQARAEPPVQSCDRGRGGGTVANGRLQMVGCSQLRARNWLHPPPPELTHSLMANWPALFFWRALFGKLCLWGKRKKDCPLAKGQLRPLQWTESMD